MSSANNRKNIFNVNSEQVVKRSIVNQQLTTNIIQLPVYDSRFTSVNQTGHTSILGSTLEDINNTDNVNWLMPANAVTLYVVSTSANDTVAGGSGIQIILIIGLDDDLQPIQDIVLLNGTTPVATNLQFKAVNVSLAVAGGTPGSGAIGNITISDENSATPANSSVWAKYLINDSAAAVGRYTVALGHRFIFTGVYQNGGMGADMTVRSELTPFGGFPFAIGDTYYSDVIATASGASVFFIEGGSTFKFRAFTNSGNPASRQLSTTIFGILGTEAAWESIQVDLN